MAGSINAQFDQITRKPVDQDSKNKSACVSLPENIFGVLSVDELKSLTTAAPIIKNYPNGLLGVKVNFFQAGSAAASKRVFVAFNNTAFNDVNVIGLRRSVVLGSESVFAFDATTVLPTQITFLADADETALGDTEAYIEAVQKP